MSPKELGPWGLVVFAGPLLKLGACAGPNENPGGAKSAAKREILGV